MADDLAEMLGAPSEPPTRAWIDRGKQTKGARKATPLNMTLVSSLARAGCTTDEIAAVVGMSRQAFARRLARQPKLADLLGEQRLVGLAALKVRMHMAAVRDGDARMMVWASANRLGWSAKPEANAIADASSGTGWLVETREKLGAQDWERRWRVGPDGPTIEGDPVK